MTLPRDIVTDGLLAELDRLEQLIRPLTDAQWNTPSRCLGWTAGDVARHAIGQLTDVTSGRLDGLGTPEVTAREVAERKGRSAAELADECTVAIKAVGGLLPMFDDDAWAGPAGGGYDGTVGEGVEALWYDVYLHADDIRAAIGHPTALTSGLTAARSHVAHELAKLGWTAPLPADDTEAHQVILVATGRADQSALGAAAPPNLYAA